MELINKIKDNCLVWINSHANDEHPFLTEVNQSFEFFVPHMRGDEIR